LGVYATSAAIADLWLVLVIGLVGFVMRHFEFPLAPIMIGVILGPLAESSFRNALLSSGGDYSILVGSPIAIGMYTLMAIVLLAAVFRRVHNNPSVAQRVKESELASAYISHRAFAFSRCTSLPDRLLVGDEVYLLIY